MSWDTIFGMVPLVMQDGGFVGGHAAEGDEEGMWDTSQEFGEGDGLRVNVDALSGAPLCLYVCLQDPASRRATGYRLTCSESTFALARMLDGADTPLVSASSSNARGGVGLIANRGRVDAWLDGTHVCGVADSTYTRGFFGVGSVGQQWGSQVAGVTVRGGKTVNITMPPGPKTVGVTLHSSTS